MAILLIGATGRTGRLILAEALSRGLLVLALVRDPTTLEPQHNLTILQGSPLSLDDILSAINSSRDVITAIVTALNARRASDSPFAKVISPPRLLADSHANLVSAMKSHPEIQKIIIMSASGVGDSLSYQPWIFRLLLRKSNMAAQFKDHDTTDAETKASGVNFVLVRPARLTEEEAAPVKEFGDQGKGTGLMSAISKKSVAKFMIDAVEKGHWDRRTPVICN